MVRSGGTPGKQEPYSLQPKMLLPLTDKRDNKGVGCHGDQGAERGQMVDEAVGVSYQEAGSNLQLQSAAAVLLQ